MQNLIKKYDAVQELWAFSLKDLYRPKWCSAEPCHHFAYQWLDNFKINMQNLIQIYHVVQVMSCSIFTNWSQAAVVMLCKPSSIIKGCYPCQWLDNVDIQNVYAKCDEIYCVVQHWTDMGIFTNCSGTKLAQNFREKWLLPAGKLGRSDSQIGRS